MVSQRTSPHVRYYLSGTTILSPAPQTAIYLSHSNSLLGHRFKTTHDFDFVSLDILYTYAEDSGEYLVKATNDLGQDTTKALLQCKGMLHRKFHLTFSISIPRLVREIMSTSNIEMKRSYYFRCYNILNVLLPFRRVKHYPLQSNAERHEEN